MSMLLPARLPSISTSVAQIEKPTQALTNTANTNPALMNFDRHGFAVTQEPLLRRVAPWVASICGGLLIGLVLTQVFTASQPATPQAPSATASAIIVAQ